jgi:hypothetical protein
MFFQPIKVLPFDELDLDLRQDGFGQPSIRAAGASTDLPPLVTKTHPPHMVTFK